ncbi:hypothetical protein JQN58_01540 [Aneurinibacillus sp. BA2021]|nr:hypothetical protein [Aneurinibacillus sp. BA2021]
MEEMLKKLLEMQERTEKQLNEMQEDIQNIKQALQGSEHQQDSNIMNRLIHVEEQVKRRESETQVLNRRLFTVESKIEQLHDKLNNLEK